MGSVQDEGELMRTWIWRGIVGWVGWLSAPLSVLAFSASFEQLVITEDREVRSTVKIQDQMFRVETESEGSMVTLIKNAEGLFSLMPEQNIAMKFPPEEGANEFELMQHAQDYSAYLESKGAEYVGEEEVEGLPCEAYTLPKQAMRVCVQKDPVFPLKVEAPDSTVYFSNIQFDIPTSADDFILPIGVQVLDLEGIDLAAVLNAAGTEPASAEDAEGLAPLPVTAPESTEGDAAIPEAAP
jgi:outer membrane lipoprotein-sorting protein